MDRAEFIRRRKGRYMAQVLEGFEDLVEPLLPDAQAKQVKDFKALVRMRMEAFATDAAELLEMGETVELNGLAQELRDRLSPTGRP